MNKIYINIFIIFIRIINFQINLTYNTCIQNNYFQINNFILYKILIKVLYNENYET